MKTVENSRDAFNDFSSSAAAMMSSQVLVMKMRGKRINILVSGVLILLMYVSACVCECELVCFELQ